MYGVDPLAEWRGCRRQSSTSFPAPRRLARAAVSQGHDYVALLESGGGFQERARYSIVGIGARRVVEERSPHMVYRALERLGGECTRLPCREMAFIAVSYEAVVGAEPWLDPYLGRHEWPLLIGFMPETLVVYDHAAGRVIRCGPEPVGVEAGLQGFMLDGVLYETRREDYIDWVGEARELIRSGEAFQIVLSRVKEYGYRGEPLIAYERLASINPSPYMFYLRMNSRVIAGTSPELLVKLDSGVLETHPIAGTRPRGSGEDDIRLEEELLSDEKELAEHIMLIDLARNDLGSIAVPGTVRIPVVMDIEKYSHVQHIVSRVEAQARPGLGFHEALKHTLPAGTVSGAPKPRAMEIIAKLEDKPRGPYAGGVGIAAGMAGEAAITIRSFWTTEAGIEIRAGAGIVYDSKPEKEYMETEYKLEAIKKALGG
ncbi:MAG: anthranilate synthase component I family protein [Desulfurococcales archaeon]|nr:anthranilate synthase component I family protein [Desulfurococcales archaeon]